MINQIFLFIWFVEYKMYEINNPISPVPIPKIIGARIEFIFPSRRVIITKTRVINSNCFGNLNFIDFFNIWGASVRINKKRFVEAMCHKELFIEVIIDRIKISFIVIDKYLLKVSDMFN